MMLFSCLKKTIGQSQPDKWQQRKLFERASFQRSMPGHVPDRVQVNQGFSDSAVALTVDTLRDARRVVESLQDIAKGRSPTGMGDRAQTLQKMYPFLDDSKERGLLEQYEGQLKNVPEGDPRRAVLQNAVARTRALMGKKTQMRLEFMNMLRFLSDRANEALEVFEQPGFSQALDTALRQAHEPSQTVGLALQAVLAGVPLRDLAPSALEELSERVGNSAMASLAKLCPPPCTLVSFQLPQGELDTSPFEVPAVECPLAAPEGLTEGGGNGA